MTACDTCPIRAELNEQIENLTEQLRSLRIARLDALNNAERLRYRLREAGLYAEKTQ